MQATGKRVLHTLELQKQSARDKRMSGSIKIASAASKMITHLCQQLQFARCCSSFGLE
jgi:hypothetical protein